MYKVVTGRSKAELETNCNELEERGYIYIGGIAIDGDGMLYQAMHVNGLDYVVHEAADKKYRIPTDKENFFLKNMSSYLPSNPAAFHNLVKEYEIDY